MLVTAYVGPRKNENLLTRHADRQDEKVRHTVTRVYTSVAMQTDGAAQADKKEARDMGTY